MKKIAGWILMIMAFTPIILLLVTKGGVLATFISIGITLILAGTIAAGVYLITDED